MGRIFTTMPAAGVRRLIVVDIGDFALNAALCLGAAHTVHSKKYNSKQAILDAIPGCPDRIVEAAGTTEAALLMASYSHIRPENSFPSS